MEKEETIVVDDDKSTAEAEGKTAVEETTKNADDQQDDQGKQKDEDNPFKQELEKLKEINRQKTGALEQERQKRKDAENKLKETKHDGLTAEEADKIIESKLEAKIEARLAKRDFDNLLKQTSDDKHERELIGYHYDNSIVKTGDVEADLKKAIALANSHLIQKAKEEQYERETREGFLANQQGGLPTSYRGRSATHFDPTLKGANALLQKLGVKDGEKYLKK